MVEVLTVSGRPSRQTVDGQAYTCFDALVDIAAMQYCYWNRLAS
jgi:hypothetical protein